MNIRSRRHVITAIEEPPKPAVSPPELRAPHRPRTEWPDRSSVSATAVLTVFWGHASRLYVSALLGQLLEVIVIAAWKLTNEANRIRLALKHRNGE